MRGLALLAAAFSVSFLALFLTHYPILQLPFYWDELGQFVPAALDIYHRLAWVPFTTVPNVHPPGVMAYLALVWRVAGYSVPVTRIAMLALAACGLVAQWRLARTLSRETLDSDGPAWLAVVFLFCSPLFFAQSPMAQLDLPAMVFTTIALALFLEKRNLSSAVVCIIAVLVKETAIAAPALFGFVLLRRHRIPSALLFAAPLVPIAIWLEVLHRSTGHWFGSPEFTDYNLFYPLHPVRLGMALLRRSYYLAIGSGHVVGFIALIFWIRRPDQSLSNKWRICFSFVLLHVILICVLGGAVLERYLLPVLPLLYSAFATAIWSLKGKSRQLLAAALPLCLLAACVVNPLYPFPMENNLAWTTFVTLNREAARFTELALPGRVVASSFPVAGSLRRPELGYVSRPIPVLEIQDFREANLSQKVRGHAGALVYYSVLWDPLRLLQNPWWVSVLRNYYGYVPQASSEDIPRLTGMRALFQLCSAGQCIEVFSGAAATPNTPTALPLNR